MDNKQKCPAIKQGHQHDYNSKDTHSSRIIQQVRALFLSGGKYTATEINDIIGFNDARKVISTLRSHGWDIKDIRMGDRRKLYWLEKDKGQLDLLAEEGA